MASIAEQISFQLREGIAHGVVIEAGDAAGAGFAVAAGHADPAHRVPMRRDTVIDVASVTKVVATTTALLQVHDMGLLDLDAPFAAYLPAYSAPLAQPITVRDLAMHISGFGPQRYCDRPTGPEIRELLLSVPPPNPYGLLDYSCWNFHLLALIVEELTGQSLPAYCREHVFAPLGMADTNLGQPPPVASERLAQTCATDRPGQISDPYAFRLYRDGLSAGNAGAFSTAPDLGRFCRCLLGGGQGLFSPAAFAEIATPRFQAGPVARSFGWIVADEWRPPAASAHTIYHSGWSGQTVFLDLERQFYAVVLTTRTLNEHDRARKGRFRLIDSLLGDLAV